MANKRVFYAMKRVGIGPADASSFIQARGVQTVSSTTTFEIQQAFELGQLPIYENIEGIPSISLQLSLIHI